MPIQRLDTLLALKAIHLASGLNANERRVAAALLEHFNRRTGQCDPSLERIAELLGISTRTVIRSTHRLDRAGLFKKTRHGGHFNVISTSRCGRAFEKLRRRGGHGSIAERIHQRQKCHLLGVKLVTLSVTTLSPKPVEVTC